MNKTELIDAIQQVITPNGQKAITAESLANLLIEMVEAMGESSGGGISFIIRIGVSTDGNLIPALTVEDVAYNKSQIEVLKQLIESGKPVPPIAMNMCADDSLGNASISQYCMSQVVWNIPSDEDIPEGLILPCIISEMPFFVNGDGNLLYGD